MKRFSKKQLILFFYSFDFILLLILVLILIPFGKSHKNSISKTALLNPKYKNIVQKIELSFPLENSFEKENYDFSSESLNQENADFCKKFVFFKTEDFWYGVLNLFPKEKSEDSKEQIFSPVIFPLESQTVQNMIEKFSLIDSVYKKADGKSSFSSYNLEEDEAMIICFYDVNGEVLSKIYFGREDSISSRISFRTDSSDEVFEIDNSLCVYLSSSISFWADPFVEPECLTHYSRNLAQQGLRHGKIYEISILPELKSDKTFTKYFENGSGISFDVFKTEAGIVVKPKFISGPLNSEDEKKVFSEINYFYSLSTWTYEKFEKLFDE